MHKPIISIRCCPVDTININLILCSGSRQKKKKYNPKFSTEELETLSTAMMVLLISDILNIIQEYN